MEASFPAKPGSSNIISRRRRRKWLATAASIWIQCSSGASYAFGIYSPLLKSTQNYNQSTLDAISVSKDIGANFGTLSGLLYSSVLPWGPWVVHLVGAIQCFVGYFFIWLSVAGIIPNPPVAVMCVFMLLGAHSQTFFNTANVVTAVHNFPDYSGTIVGVMKGFLGLSGAILIQVYLMLFKGNPGTFLLILAVLPTLLTVTLMFFVRIDSVHSRDDKKHLNRLSVFSLIVVAYLMILIILRKLVDLPSWSGVPALLVLLLLLSSPLSIVFSSLGDNNASSSVSPLIENSDRYNPASSVQKRDGPEDVKNFAEDKNLLQAAGTVNFWLLFVAMLCGMGSGLATVNNISQIGESLGYSAVERSTLVSLWSIWNFLGRFGAGYVSDIFLHKKGWGRPMFMAIMLAAMTTGHIIIASGFPGNLYVGSILVGICYGSQWSLMPTITCEIFGVLHMGTIFNTIAIASPVGSYLLSVRVIGYIYDTNTSDSKDICYGKHCFMLSFYILASFTLFGSFAALGLFFRTRRFYSQIASQWLRRDEID